MDCRQINWPKKAVLLGTLILFFSYLIISFFKTDKSLCVALAGITVGTGLLKPNISSLLGNEYHNMPASRESGFTIFYMGITLGIILGTTLPSLISEKFGWSSAFYSAALGMIFAALSFVHGIRTYKIQDYFVIKSDFEKSTTAFGLICSLWLLAYYLLRCPYLADTAFISVAIICAIYLINCSKKRKSIKPSEP